MADFIDALRLAPADRDKLKTLGAKTPFALLAMRKASPEAFDAYVGANVAADLSRQLEPSLSDDERAQLDAPADFERGFGALPPDEK